MIKKIRIRLARWILGQHCQQRSADSLMKKMAKK